MNNFTMTEKEIAIAVALVGMFVRPEDITDNEMKAFVYKCRHLIEVAK